MKFERRYAPWVAASTDETRTQLLHVMLDVEKSRLLATTGHIAVAIPCKVDPKDVSGPILKDALKWAAEHCGASEWAEVNCSSAERVQTGDASFVRPAGITFLPIDSVIPDWTGKKVHRFGIDSRLLLRLARALGATPDEEDGGTAILDLTVLAVNDMLEVIEARAHGAPEATGVIMPCRTDI